MRQISERWQEGITSPLRIEDPGDPRIAHYRGLKDRELRRRTETEHGIFVVEGARALRALLGSPFPLISVLLTPERAASLPDLVAAALGQGAPVYLAGRAVFDAIAGFPVHRGVLATAGRLTPREPPEVLQGIRAAAVVEAVNDHENLGSIFRNAAALGAGAVLLDPSCCDPLYRRSVRVSLGQVLRVPYARLEPWPESLRTLEAQGFALVALDPGAPSTLEEVARELAADEADEQVAVMVGSEAVGLSPEAARHAAYKARIPMAAGVDSINVATALAIALHHLVCRD